MVSELTSFGPKIMADTITNKPHRKYSCEQIYERMEKGLCLFCEELDTLGHQLKHERVKIFMMECDDDQVSEDKEEAHQIQETVTNPDPFVITVKNSDLFIEPMDRASVLQVSGSVSDVMLVHKMDLHVQEAKVLPQRSTSANGKNSGHQLFDQIPLRVTTKEKRHMGLSRSERVWEPGGLVCIQDQWSWLNGVKDLISTNMNQEEEPSLEKETRPQLFPYHQVLIFDLEQLRNNRLQSLIGIFESVNGVICFLSGVCTNRKRPLNPGIAEMFRKSLGRSGAPHMKFETGVETYLWAHPNSKCLITRNAMENKKLHEMSSRMSLQKNPEMFIPMAEGIRYWMISAWLKIHVLSDFDLEAWIRCTLEAWFGCAWDPGGSCYDPAQREWLMRVKDDVVMSLFSDFGLEEWIHELAIYFCEYKNQMLLLGYHGLEMQVLSCLQESGVGLKLESFMWLVYGEAVGGTNTRQEISKRPDVKHVEGEINNYGGMRSRSSSYKGYLLLDLIFNVFECITNITKLLVTRQKLQIKQGDVSFNGICKWLVIDKYKKKLRNVEDYANKGKNNFLGDDKVIIALTMEEQILEYSGDCTENSAPFVMQSMSIQKMELMQANETIPETNSSQAHELQDTTISNLTPYCAILIIEDNHEALWLTLPIPTSVQKKDAHTRDGAKQGTRHTNFFVWHRWKNKVENLHVVSEIRMLSFMSFPSSKGSGIVGLTSETIRVVNVNGCICDGNKKGNTSYLRVEELTWVLDLEKLHPKAGVWTENNNLKQITQLLQSSAGLILSICLTIMQNQALNCYCKAGQISSATFSAGDVHEFSTHSKLLVWGDTQKYWFHNEPLIGEGLTLTKCIGSLKEHEGAATGIGSHESSLEFHAYKVFHLQRPPELIKLHRFHHQISRSSSLRTRMLSTREYCNRINRLISWFSLLISGLIVWFNNIIFVATICNAFSHF